MGFVIENASQVLLWAVLGGQLAFISEYQNLEACEAAAKEFRFPVFTVGRIHDSEKRVVAYCIPQFFGEPLDD